MNRVKILLLCFWLQVTFAWAGSVNLKGKVVDAETQEPLVGATIILNDLKIGTVTGLDGTFNLKVDEDVHKIKLKCSYLGYKTEMKNVETDEFCVIKMSPSSSMIHEVEIVAKANGSSESGARLFEQRSPSIVNSISAHAIELSPDLSVANVIQRISGVSVERSSNGEGQYAILRGMDKRYNYTLVNGIKIPSPDNKNRYIPLDIFPADMLDRLDVTKSLTPDMEGDAVGGVVNMIMKEAPNNLQISANAAIGYSQTFFNHSFTGFDYGAINDKTPFELHGDDSNYKATMSDFTTSNLSLKRHKFRPDFNMGLTFGKRFFSNRLGLLISGSYQSNNRSTKGFKLETGAPRNTIVGMISNMKDRRYCEWMARTGLLGRIDYHFNKHHYISFTNIFVNLQNSQFRNEDVANFTKGYDTENLVGKETFRMRYKNQTIFSSFLQGSHRLPHHFTIDWTAAYAKANGKTPDNTMISISRNTVDGVLQPQEITFGNSPSISRRWEHSSDRDFSGYLDMSYPLHLGHKLNLTWKAGGLYRDKKRDNFNNEYYFTNREGTPNILVYGRDFTDFSNIPLDVYNPQGSAANALTYKAHERIGAAYLQFILKWHKWQLISGVRMEHTDQGYALKYQSPIESLRVPDGSSVYTDWLPSLHLKYRLSKHQNLRFSYFRSINRPGYFEMVPYTIINEDYTEKGNPNLKHAKIDNVDFRYEIFPTHTDQFIAGIFFKRIQDPIEYALQRPADQSSQDLFFMPGNFGTAYNFGLEINVIKYFRWLGIKANYTYTHSSIKTEKTGWVNGEQITTKQRRPLYGQSAHVANLSLLYRAFQNKLNAQFALSYTGERIASVSQFVDNDIYQKGFLMGDFSMEYQISPHFKVYAKVNNLFNTPMEEYIKHADDINKDMPHQQGQHGHTLIARERYGQSYLMGLKFKF